VMGEVLSAVYSGACLDKSMSCYVAQQDTGQGSALACLLGCTCAVACCEDVVSANIFCMANVRRAATARPSLLFLTSSQK
jgi:hypothetical protein